MSQLKLITLGLPDDFCADFEDCRHLHEVVLWLEDQHIRYHAIGDRGKLRSNDESVRQEAVKKYICDLNCPIEYSENSVKKIAEWLLDYAISCNYSEIDGAKTVTSEEFERRKAEIEMKRIADDPISSLDFNCKEFKNGVEEVRNLLGIATHPDTNVILKAFCKFVVDSLTANDVARSGRADGVQTKSMPLNSAEIGLKEDKDKKVNAAVRALRLLHLSNLREVQTQINETIVAVQKVTADPRTDARLGKVGF